MSFKVAVHAYGDPPDSWPTNSLRFATSVEAEQYAVDLFMRWTGAEDWRVEPSDDPVTVTLDAEGRRVPVQPPYDYDQLGGQPS